MENPTNLVTDLPAPVPLERRQSDKDVIAAVRSAYVARYEAEVAVDEACDRLKMAEDRSIGLMEATAALARCQREYERISEEANRIFESTQPDLASEGFLQAEGWHGMLAKSEGELLTVAFDRLTHITPLLREATTAILLYCERREHDVLTAGLATIAEYDYASLRRLTTRVAAAH